VSDGHSLGNGITARSSAAQQSAEATVRELLAYISTGDRSAIAKVYLLYFARLANFFVHVTGNADLIEELISDTMLDVWRESAVIGPNTSVSVWVMGIAYMRTQKLLAAGGSTPPHVQASIHRADHDTPGYTPRLRDLLLRLTVEERTALYLVYASDHSRQDIVYIMNLSRECVEMHLTNARLRLRSFHERSPRSAELARERF